MKSYEISRIRSHLSEELWTDFQKFMGGQTVGVTDCGEPLVYAHDLSRWIIISTNRKKLSDIDADKLVKGIIEHE